MLIPILVWVLFVAITDPVNYFGVSNIIPEKIKEKNALEVNALLFKTIDFKKNPSEYILIGDSRTNGLPTDEIEKLSGLNYKKLNTPAAKLNEIFELVYFANRQKPLKHVVIGINFNMFNEYGYNDRVTSLLDMLDKPLNYIFNRSVAQLCYYVWRAKLTGKDINSKPAMTRDEFWDWNISTKAVHWYKKYKFPDEMHAELLKLDQFATQNNILLTFIIVPHHRQFHERLMEFNLEKDEQKFLGIMKGLNAEVINFDYENEITKHRSNFNDPVHYNPEVGKLIVDEVWSKEYRIGIPL